jgi:hypothetical protein
MAQYPASRILATPARETRKAPISLALAVMVASLPLSPSGISVPNPWGGVKTHSVVVVVANTLTLTTLD